MYDVYLMLVWSSSTYNYFCTIISIEMQTKLPSLSLEHTGWAIPASHGERRAVALPAPGTRLAEEREEALLLRGFGVILGEKKIQKAHSRSNLKPKGR